MTKKQAYKIIKNKYGNFDGTSRIEPLCEFAPRKIREDWCKYWNEIDDDNLILVSEAFSYNDDDILTFSYNDDGILISLARLILLHDFIEDTYK